jgi:Transposase DDE domain group 1
VRSRGTAPAYEDLNELRRIAPRSRDGGSGGQVGSKTRRLRAGRRQVDPNRLELSRLEATRYHSHNPIAIKRLMVDLFLDAHKRAPRQIVLDLDATDDPVHGEQEGRFFNAYYDCYCYLPLYVFNRKGNQCLLRAALWAPDNAFMINIYAAVAQEERRMISAPSLTPRALAAARPAFGAVVRSSRFIYCRQSKVSGRWPDQQATGLPECTAAARFRLTLWI